MSASSAVPGTIDHRLEALDRALRDEQVRLLYANSTLSVLVTLSAATILTRLQWSVIPHAIGLAWLG